MKTIFVLIFSLLIPACTYSQKETNEVAPESGILSSVQLLKLMEKPECLEGYRSAQSGPLIRIDAKEGEKPDSTFTVEKIKVPSDGFMITGWLYLPLGEGKFPLIVLTNGGGDGSMPIKSLSDWIAPILAHCGYAAFVHDKRGTGESEGDFIKTTYNDYITDAGNCAIYLSGHEKINPDLIGILGGSEGGRIAVMAASRYPVIKFVISFAGSVVSMEDDRWFAQIGDLRSRGNTDSVINAVKPIWMRSFAAWASNDPAEHQKVNKEILEWRQKFSRSVLPVTKEEMDSVPSLSVFLSTWYSIPNDYLTELGHFNKKWLAAFGEVDQVVPTQASIKNILHYMALSGNKDYDIAVIPQCGHAPVNVETKRLIRIDHLFLNWLDQNVYPLKSLKPAR
jgi:pimeloyl-ACP methyl ester carboxylesterase